jgi:hypothetical protein
VDLLKNCLDLGFVIAIDANNGSNMLFAQDQVKTTTFSGKGTILPLTIIVGVNIIEDLYLNKLPTGLAQHTK